MPDVDEIITGLRVERAWSADEMTTVVPLDSAVAAVHAAADTRTQEIVDALRGTRTPSGRHSGVFDDAANFVVRRFPDGGTNDGA